MIVQKGQKIGKPNNLKGFGSKNTKDPQHDIGQKQLSYLDPSVIELWDSNTTFNNRGGSMGGGRTRR